MNRRPLHHVLMMVAGIFGFAFGMVRVLLYYLGSYLLIGLGAALLVW